MNTMMKMNMQKADTRRPWDPGLQKNGESIWKETVYKAWIQSKIIVRFMQKLNKLRSQDMEFKYRVGQKLCSILYEYD